MRPLGAGAEALLVPILPPNPAPLGAPVVHAGGRGPRVLAHAYLGPREVAARLDVCTATVYALIEEGELPAARVGSLLRVATTDLVVYLERQRADVR